MHTKAVAKVNRNPNLLGNRLDQWIRNSNGAQTSGIPIGPDTSLLIAEIVLWTIDRELLSRRPGLAGIRVSDDYEIACGTYSDAGATLAELQTVLAEYELRLNPMKTEIVELPRPLEKAWVRDIRSIPLRFGAAQRRDLLHLYDVVNDAMGREERSRGFICHRAVAAVTSGIHELGPHPVDALRMDVGGPGYHIRSGGARDLKS